jgi:drug/metabolite transporter (DMT)-like permease
MRAALLAALRQKRPAPSDLASLAIVALGVVVGFPLLTALALQHITSAHSIVFIRLLPLATAIVTAPDYKRFCPEPFIISIHSSAGEEDEGPRDSQ